MTFWDFLIAYRDVFERLAFAAIPLSLFLLMQRHIHHLARTRDAENHQRLRERDEELRREELAFAEGERQRQVKREIVDLRAELAAAVIERARLGIMLAEDLSVFGGHGSGPNTKIRENEIARGQTNTRIFSLLAKLEVRDTDERWMFMSRSMVDVVVFKKTTTWRDEYEARVSQSVEGDDQRRHEAGKLFAYDYLKALSSRGPLASRPMLPKDDLTPVAPSDLSPSLSAAGAAEGERDERTQ